MDVKLSGQTFTLDQTWGEWKEFLKAYKVLRAKAEEVRKTDGEAAFEAVGDEIDALEEAHLTKCLKKVDGQDFNGDLSGLQWNVGSGLTLRLHNPMMELSTRLPFEEKAAQM